MLAELLYSFWPYQIFRSVSFRGGMAFVSTYVLVSVLMPSFIRWLRLNEIFGDLQVAVPPSVPPEPYMGPKPLGGGVVLVLGVVFSALLWMQVNQFTLALVLVLVSFAGVGALDDWSKVRHRRRVLSGLANKKSYTSKADGLGGWWRILLQFFLASVVVVVFYHQVDVDGHLVVPLIPLKWWYPYLPRYVFIPFMIFMIVGCANAVNLTDGLDSLAIVPFLTAVLFVVVAAYAGTNPSIQERLLLPPLPVEVREVVVFAAAMFSAGLIFLRFNAPPAMITLGDSGALSFGSALATMFIFTKTELFLPLVGGVFVLITLSSIIQRVFFQIMLRTRGRKIAEQLRFFYRAPYHHHLQVLWSASSEQNGVRSLWANMLEVVGLRSPQPEDRLRDPTQVNSRVVWHLHVWSLWLLVIAMVIYLKVR